MKNKVYFLLGFIGIFSTGVQAQIISTKAGSAMGGYSGDGGQATAAKLLAPAGVTLDAEGNLFIADEYNNCIRKVSTAGVISTVAGNDTAGFSGDSSAATAARLNHPTSVAVDAAGNIYIADKENDRIRKVTAAGIIYTIAGSDMRGFGGDGDTATKAMLNRPSGVAVDAAGNVFVADQYNNRVRKINAAGVITTLVGNTWGGYNGDNFPTATMASLNKPSGVTISPSGHLYIADNENDRIRKYDTSTGKVTTFTCKPVGPPNNVGYGLLKNPSSIAFDAVGNLYVADQYHYVIKKIDSNGIMYTIAGTMNYGYSGDGGNATAAKLSYVKGITVDPAGNLYIADWGNNRVRYISTTVGTSIIKAQSKGFSIYPNPSETGRFTFTISSANTEKVTLVVTDMAGRIVYTGAAETNKTAQIELTQPTGMYVITAYSANMSWTERISIQN